jgi:hypothetical protein
MHGRRLGFAKFAKAYYSRSGRRLGFAKFAKAY